MLRFAISPTGDMHIGNLRSALINYIMAKKLNKKLLIRIDDTDRKNNIEGKEKEILELLSLFSIDHEHVVYQSENMKYHQKLAMQLMTQKKAFSCFCSNEKLNELKQKAKDENRPFSYDDFCATLSDEAVLEVNAPFTVRMKRPEENIGFKDLLQGDFDFTPTQIDSFFILNHDKLPVYNYACAIDDMLYDISMVIRSEENLENTPRQIHLRKALGYDKELEYLHLPTIKDAESITVKSLIDQGFLPAAIANYLVALEMKTPSEVFDLEDTLNWFEINNLSKDEIEFDIEKLKEINKKHLENLDELRLSKLLGFADTDIGKLAKIYLSETSTLKEIKEKLDSIFSRKEPLKGFEDEFNKLKECLKTAPYFETLKELEEYITEKTALKDESLSKPLRYILTSINEGPDLNEIYPLIKNYLGEIVK